MNSPNFPIIILNARPGAGKSEIVDFLKKVPPEERQYRFHINQLEVFDDFPILWTWFEEDDLLESMGYPRLHTNKEGYFTEQYLWHLLIKRLCQEYEKGLRDTPNYHESYTTIIEFSRGTEHGGYSEAYKHLSPLVLRNAAVMYVRVSWEESVRKNNARFNPDRPHSILEHKLEDAKMEKLYRDDDWLQLNNNDAAYITIQGVKVPSVVLENEDDVTTERGTALGDRLELTLNKLWKRFTVLHSNK